jgi:hypothetical protein
MVKAKASENQDKSKEMVKVKASENQDSSYLLTYQDWLAGYHQPCDPHPN